MPEPLPDLGKGRSELLRRISQLGDRGSRMTSQDGQLQVLDQLDLLAIEVAGAIPVLDQHPYVEIKRCMNSNYFTVVTPT
jgi:hypothetical protein